RFVGVAGPRMQAEGCEAWYEMEELAVMGTCSFRARIKPAPRISPEVYRRPGQSLMDAVQSLTNQTAR
ncbi:hypothetical protein ACUODJ_61335, partial [Escherichia sp. HC-CC]